MGFVALDPQPPTAGVVHMIGAGKLDKRIALLRPAVIDDGLRQKSTYTEVRTAFAQVQWVSDGERFSAGENARNTVLRITIRTNKTLPVDTSWRVTYAGKTYALTGVKPNAKDDAFIELTAGLVGKDG